MLGGGLKREEAVVRPGWGPRAVKATACTEGKRVWARWPTEATDYILRQLGRGRDEALEHRCILPLAPRCATVLQNAAPTLPRWGLARTPTGQVSAAVAVP